MELSPFTFVFAHGSVTATPPGLACQFLAICILAEGTFRSAPTPAMLRLDTLFPTNASVEATANNNARVTPTNILFLGILHSSPVELMLDAATVGRYGVVERGYDSIEDNHSHG